MAAPAYPDGGCAPSISPARRARIALDESQLGASA
jgi:hypothetical protein